jgi:dihydroorotase
MLGLQHALGLTVEALGGPDGADLVALFALLSRRPAAIARLRAEDPRLAGHTAHGGDLAVGTDANLCVVDLATPPIVSLEALASRARNTPYLGRTLPVTVRHTVLRGEPMVRDGVATR